MRVLVGVLVLGLCGWQTFARVPDWRADQALWAAATVTAPMLPRPWLNLAVTAMRSSREPEAWVYLDRAVAVSQHPRHVARRPIVLSKARSVLLWLDAIDPRCDQPAWRALCASLE